MNQNMIELSLDNKTFPSYLAKPEGEAKGALIVIHEVWGLTDHIKSIADRFAAEGYLVLAPDLLYGNGIDIDALVGLQPGLFDPEKRSAVQPKLRELMAPIQAPEFAEVTLNKTQVCFDYLSSLPNIDGRVGITGFCFGGSYSFSLAVHQPKLKVAIPYYGHADFTVEQLKNINCPVLAFYGENDENLMNSLPDLKEKMTQAGVNFTAQVYKDCGHAFFNDTNKFTYNPVAANDAWNKTLKLLGSVFSKT
jgi:carboxymethylenebutenolidase